MKPTRKQLFTLGLLTPDAYLGPLVPEVHETISKDRENASHGTR